MKDKEKVYMTYKGFIEEKDLPDVVPIDIRSEFNEDFIEMEKTMRKVYEKYGVVSLPLFTQELYNAGYRNCKDKVVLSREEQEYIQSIIKKRIKEARKETAEKIYDYVEWYIMDDPEVELMVKEWFITIWC